MPTIAVMPIRSFTGGKGRLADSLSDGARSALGEGMAIRTLEAVELSGFIPIVVTGDDEVVAWATATGVPSVPDSGTGLSAAAKSGVQWALETGSNWIVIHSDLPLLRPVDLAPVGESLQLGLEPIVPSTDGGTSLIGSRGEVEFEYGPGSFHRHLPRLSKPAVITNLGLQHDLDTRSDLRSALAHRRGEWLAGLVG